MKYCLLILAFLPLVAIAQTRRGTTAEASAEYVNALSLGLKADASPGGPGHATDNYQRLQAYMDSLPSNGMAHIFFPEGGYFFSRTISIRNGKGIDFRGARAMPYLNQQSATRFFFAADQHGIAIIGGRLENERHVPGALPSSISDIGVVAYGSSANARSAGVYHEAICQLERVYSEGFAFGFYTLAEIAYPMQGNSSLSIYMSCRANRNKLDGFFAGGPDANAISYVNCVSVLNNRWGFLDSSLLGNFYYGCQTATNGRDGSEAIAPYQGGGYGIMQADAHAIVSGCYSEGDQLPNYLPPVSNANVIGGLHPAGWCSNLPGQPFREPGGGVQSGAMHNQLKANHLQTPQITLGSGVSLKNSGDYGGGARPGFYNNDTVMVELLGPGTPMSKMAATGINPLRPGRSVSGQSIVLPTAQWLGGQLQIYGDTAMSDVVFMYGDRIINASWSEGKPDHWRVIRPGRNQQLQPFSIVKLEAQPDQQGFQELALQDDRGYAQLRVGDMLTLSSGAEAQIWRLNERYLVEVRKPAARIAEGEKINFMGGWLEQLAPVSYSDTNMLLSYAPFARQYSVGEQAVVDGLATTVRSVRVEKGVQFVELNFPAGAQADWFRVGNAIGWGKENQTRQPAAYDHSDAARPTVTLAFPMPDLEPGAGVWVNGQKSTVTKIHRPGLLLKISQGSMARDQRAPTSFRVQRPAFKGY